MAEVNHSAIKHEPDSADIRGVGLTGLALALGIAIILFLVHGIFNYLLRHRAIVTPANPFAETERQQFPPPPRIQVEPSRELTDLRDNEDHVLSTYGWVDKQAGTVRIPIDRAMEIQLSRGLPVRKEATAK